jgi:hypothetical protein
MRWETRLPGKPCSSLPYSLLLTSSEGKRKEKNAYPEMERGSGARGIPAGEIRKSSKENLSHASLEK